MAKVQEAEEKRLQLQNTVWNTPSFKTNEILKQL
jgi:hypothetical protein